MAEIHLPTKGTQDSIKQDTQFIRGQFPISGGTDFSEYTPLFFKGKNIDKTPTTMVDITGSGLLTSIGVNLSSVSTGDHRAIISIDGEIVLEVTRDNAISNDTMVVTPFVEFKNSLKIQLIGVNATYFVNAYATVLLK